MTPDPITIFVGQQSVTTALHYPAERPSHTLLVLAHGAGAGQRHPFMIAMAQGLAGRGMDLVTFDFPYMHQRRKVPDKAAVLEGCFATVIRTVRARAELSSHRLFIGGKSMGGRMATHLGAQKFENLEGIVVLGYPLHPPGKPQQLRVQHLPSIEARLLIVQGERDTFGTPSELAPVLAAMHAPVTLHVVSGGDHSLAVRGKGGSTAFESVLDAVATWIDGRSVRP